ncbi:MAG: DUF3147 family protein [Solirubrobacteraceae bacterium]
MSEPTLLDSPREPVRVRPGGAGELRARDLVIRFAFGAGTSIAAGVTTLVFGARTGGILLAFPAILAASLTLIAEESDKRQAREDARGATAGAVALGCFAAVAALLFGALPGGAVLAIATGSWALVAVGIYHLAWGRRA